MDMKNTKKTYNENNVSTLSAVESVTDKLSLRKRIQKLGVSKSLLKNFFK